MELEILNIEGKKTGKKAKLDDAVFGIEPNDHAIYLDVKQYRANVRQGTHKSKERGEITGSRRKIKKQKGTGTARAGDIKNPIFRGGGRAFGPRPRTYSSKLNKKVKQLARRSALSHMIKDGKIMVLDSIKMDAPKTQAFAEMVEKLKLDGRNSLFVLSEKNDNVLLSSRNLQKARVTTASQLNTYDILNCHGLVLMQDSIEHIEKSLKS